MSDLPKACSIVTIGGGVMGASTLYHLAKQGMADAVLLEKEAFFGTGATGRCAGGVRYQFSTEVNVRLSQESLPMLEGLEEETGVPSGYRKIGYLILLTNERDVRQFEENVRLQRELGVPTEWLDRPQVADLVPQVRTDDMLAATFCREDGIADPHSVVSGYIGAAKRLGATAVTDAAVTNITRDNGKFHIETTQGMIVCDTVINAAGPWSQQVSDMLGVPLPITPLRRQWLTTTPLPDLNERFPFVIDFAQSLYFHPEGAGLLTGMSSPHEQDGFDQSVDDDWELTHMERAVERLPLLETAGRQSRYAGLYENTPDAHPIIDEVADGYFVVAGFSGHGFMHGPIAGKLMSEMVLDGEARTVDVSGLGFGRFTNGRTLTEYNVI